MISWLSLMLINIVLIAGSYLFGTLPFAVAMTRASGLDPSQEADLHIALWHKVGKMRALLAALVDFMKGIIPVLVAFGLNLSPAVVAFCGVAATAGQMWPPLRRSHGEKGNTTGGGAMITLLLVYQAYFVLLALIPAIVAAVLALTVESGHSRAMPVGNLIAFAMVPLLSWCSGQPGGIIVGSLVLLAILIVRRLTAGLKADLKAGGRVASVLANRFIFDQAFVDGTEE